MRLAADLSDRIAEVVLSKSILRSLDVDLELAPLRSEIFKPNNVGSRQQIDLALLEKILVFVQSDGAGLLDSRSDDGRQIEMLIRRYIARNLDRLHQHFRRVRILQRYSVKLDPHPHKIQHRRLGFPGCIVPIAKQHNLSSTIIR